MGRHGTYHGIQLFYLIRQVLERIWRPYGTLMHAFFHKWIFLLNQWLKNRRSSYGFGSITQLGQAVELSHSMQEIFEEETPRAAKLARCSRTRPGPFWQWPGMNSIISGFAFMNWKDISWELFYFPTTCSIFRWSMGSVCWIHDGTCEAHDLQTPLSENMTPLSPKMRQSLK